MFLVLFLIANFATSDIYNDFEYTRQCERDGDDCEINITKYTGSNSEVTIPSRISRSEVKIIGYAAFEGNTKITKVTIPEQIEIIGDKAFKGCTSLSEVNFERRGDSDLHKIGESAFEGCSSLKSFNIPNDVHRIERRAFYGTALSGTVTLPEDLEVLGIAAFGNCHGIKKFYKRWDDDDLKLLSNTIFVNSDTVYQSNGRNPGQVLAQYPAGSDNKRFDIMEGTTDVQEGAFEGATNLETIQVPDSLSSNSAKIEQILSDSGATGLVYDGCPSSYVSGSKCVAFGDGCNHKNTNDPSCDTEVHPNAGQGGNGYNRRPDGDGKPQLWVIIVAAVAAAIVVIIIIVVIVVVVKRKGKKNRSTTHGIDNIREPPTFAKANYPSAKEKKKESSSDSSSSSGNGGQQFNAYPPYNPSQPAPPPVAYPPAQASAYADPMEARDTNPYLGITHNQPF